MHVVCHKQNVHASCRVPGMHSSPVRFWFLNSVRHGIGSAGWLPTSESNCPMRRMTQGWCRDQHDLISLRYGSVLAWQTGHRNSQIVLSTFDFRSTTTTCYGTHDHSPPSLQDLRSRQLVRWHPATQAAHPMTYEGPQKVSCQLPAMPCATEGASANATMLCSQASVLNLRPGTRDVQCDNNTGL